MTMKASEERSMRMKTTWGLDVSTLLQKRGRGIQAYP